MRVLFIGYYFDPFPGIGAKRITYWAQNISERLYNNKKINSTVITATEQKTLFKNINFVPATDNTLLSKLFRTDKGSYWVDNLSKFLDKDLNENLYDVAIITGNPFLHFFIINKLKNKGIKVILDFRDPFSTNPRGTINNSLISKLKLSILKRIEYYFIKKSDAVITVNKYCAQLIEGYEEFKNKFHIIDNGFDEKSFINLREKNTSNELKFVYAGSLYKDRNPELFITVLEKYQDSTFYHIGPKSEFFKFKYSKLKELGTMSYEKTIEFLNECDICLIFTSGFPFESTTKIFDYIALNKIILIITDGEIKTGALHEITKDYPNVIWCKNSEVEINNCLKSLTRYFDLKPFADTYKFSRAHGLTKLIEVISKV